MLMIEEILMKSFNSCLLRCVQDIRCDEQVLTDKFAIEESLLRQHIGKESARNPRIGELSDEDCRLVLRISGELFLRPTRFSMDLAHEYGLEREHLIRLYHIIRNMREIQDVLTFDSPLRRRVSFLHKELLPENLPIIKSMFRGDICLPNHVEFHPALFCNLRCKACPNCHSDINGEWHFLGYPEVGQPLNADRLRMIEDMFLGLGVESFSFGGGGEPTLSDLTVGAISHLRERSSSAYIALYSNGIFPESWGDLEFETLMSSLNKLRFSIDSANAMEWSQYKGRPPEFFEILWENIGRVVEARRRIAGATNLGASCIVSSFTYRNLEAFLLRARDMGLDFCDIKAVETCFGDKTEYKAISPEFRESFDTLMAKVRSGFFTPLDVVVDDSLLAQDDTTVASDEPAVQCWVSTRGRMLTVGPYGELYPCSDAANPGAHSRRPQRNTVGQLNDFAGLGNLTTQFTSLWSESLPWRTSLSRASCPYCVPSHNNYNLAIEKLFQDWQFGIKPEEQPFGGEHDHYQASRGAR
jgi:MoaA/NifB/PqqE/SkfB family radical SAM enzyme